MTPSILFRLLILSAIWGASFMFTRITVPVLGPAWLIEFRLILASIFLALVSIWQGRSLRLRQNWRYYLILGCINSAVPFLCFAFAAKTISASLLSIMNATAPLWGTLIGAVVLRTPLKKKSLIGLGLGLAGVALLSGFDESALRPGASLAICATLAAAFCYAYAGIYAKSVKHVDPLSNAHGSMWAAALFTMPLVTTQPLIPMPNIGVIAAVFVLGVFCSGLAYLMYFRIVSEIGAASALTVTFLIPVFGVLFGHIFLGEAVGWHTLIGAIIVLTGTVLVTGFSPTMLFQRSK